MSLVTLVTHLLRSIAVVCHGVILADGVIVGNYRCSLAGLDLNRMYQAPDSRLQPVICAFKEMCRAFTLEREVRGCVWRRGGKGRQEWGCKGAAQSQAHKGFNAREWLQRDCSAAASYCTHFES
jgi:hypothetical protein